MIADLILDRRMGVPYDAKKFYDYVRSEEDMFEFDPAISRAMDGGSEEDVKKALCRYIVDQGYNDRVCDYINSVDWLGEYVDSARKPIKSAKSNGMKYYVYAGYYENFISGHELPKPYVLRDEFETFEDAYDYLMDEWPDEGVFFTQDVVDANSDFYLFNDEDWEKWVLKEDDFDETLTSSRKSIKSSRKISSVRVNELAEQEKDDLYEIEKNEAEEYYNSLDNSDKQMLRARYGIKNVKDYVKFFIVHPNKLSDDYEFMNDPRTKLNSHKPLKSALSRDEILEQIEFYEQQIEDTENLLNGEYNDVGRNKRKLLERRLKDFKDGLARLNELLDEKSIKSAKEPEQKEKVSVDVNSLYHFLTDSETAEVEGDFALVRCDEDDGETYYDILSDGDLACMDGETCEIVGRGEGFVELHSIEADDGVNFKLSPEEFEVACGKSKKQIKSSLTSDSFEMMIDESRKMTEAMNSNLDDWWITKRVGQDVVYFVAEHKDYSVRVRFEFVDSGFCYVSKTYTNGSYYEPVVLESWKYEGLSSQEIEGKMTAVLNDFFPKYNEIGSSKKPVESSVDYEPLTKLLDDLSAYPESRMPPAGIYKRLLDWKVGSEGMDETEARKKFGTFTVGEWIDDLKESMM